VVLYRCLIILNDIWFAFNQRENMFCANINLSILLGILENLMRNYKFEHTMNLSI
jgi:hypothetical protein